MACAADFEDEFEEFRSRAYSAGTSLREKRNQSPHGASRRTGSVRRDKGRHGSYSVSVTSDYPESYISSRMHDMEISEDSGCYGSGAEDVHTESMIRLRRSLENKLTLPDPSLSPGPGRHYRSLSCRRSRRRGDLEQTTSFSRQRTSSMPARSRKPDAESLRQSYQMRQRQQNQEPSTDYTFYRVRSFTTNSKGIVNRGDSFKVRKSTSQMSLDSTGSAGCARETPQKSKTHSSQESVGSPGGSSTEGDIPRHSVLMVGSNGVGKTALTQQFMTSENVGHQDTSMDADDCELQLVTVSLDGQEAQLHVLDISPDDDPWTVVASHKRIDAYVVVYSVSDPTSFDDAVDALHELRKEPDTGACILVANKGDIVRNREVSEESGKIMAVRYDCKYIEVSAVLNHKVDELLAGILQQIRLKRKHGRRRKRKCFSDENSCMQDAARGLISRLFKNHQYAFGSCDNLLVL